MILETNPFYAASLTPRAGGGFELINYDPVGKDAAYSARVMRTIGRNGPRVNVRFSVKSEGGLAIDGFDIYENGVKVEPSAEHDHTYWASVVLYDLFFVSQTLHASIHIFHYVTFCPPTDLLACTHRSTPSPMCFLARTHLYKPPTDVLP